MTLRKHHFGILVLTLVFLVGGLSSYTLVKNGYFPVARAGGGFISYRTAQENAQVSRRLYAQGLAGSSAELNELFKKGNEKDLFKNSLENLIVTEVIKSSVGEDILKEISRELEKNFDQAAMANITLLVKNIYDWDTEKFKKRILEPQALLDVITRQKGKDFEGWLQQVKTQARVSVWFVPFEWREGRLVNK